MKVKAKAKTPIALMILSIMFPLVLISVPNSSASNCSKSELKQYNKARQQVIINNTIIQIAYDIKDIIEEKRQRLSDLNGRYVDYTAKDLYDLERQDDAIDRARDDRSEWEPILRKLAKKCGKKMTSRSELSPDYYKD